MNAIHKLLSSAALAGLLAAPLAAQIVPGTINYQATLTDTDSGELFLDGTPGTVTAIFRIFNSAGTQVWEETQNGVFIFQGRLSTTVGSQNDLPGGFATLHDVFEAGGSGAFSLELSVEYQGSTTTFSPRQKILPTAQALVAEHANRATFLGNETTPGKAPTAGRADSAALADNATIAARLDTPDTLGQHIDLYAGTYGIGIQSLTLYNRSQGGFAWHSGGTHDPNQNDPGAGGTLLANLDGFGLTVNGRVKATGPAAGLQFDSRNEFNGRHWQWYAEATGARLWHSVTGDQLLLDPEGDLTVYRDLEVQRDIKFGPSAQYHAAAGEEKLRIVRGTISAFGVIEIGTGFAVARTETGGYQMVFNPPFAGDATMTVSTQVDGALIFGGTDPANAASEASVRTRNIGTVPVDVRWSFIAVGPR